MDSSSEIINLGLTKMGDYLGNLDWSYILSLIIIAYFLSKNEILSMMPIGKFKWVIRMRPFLLGISQIWRMFLIGILYGVFIYWVRDYHGKTQLESMVDSFLFALVFHKLFIEAIIVRIETFIIPKIKKNNNGTTNY